ncbi:HAD family hydrolase [Streptomyces hygroscopicus subsp. hygroscopicus]|uniref:HAD family hydrolase n=1 Tax=Streptomyces hygroscopicus TaxID=1912 RepID=UPI001C65815B|nr:HAD family hydrolase [Streptomyces hygroscopicus]MBW8090330.1 HAD family hydrolase [Streptomyces hygroscopicus subsp. hygroscopicus]
MPAAVVFDCFETLIMSPPLPGPETFTTRLAEVLRVDQRCAAQTVDTVYTAVFAAMSDRSALQPPTIGLLDAALRKQGEQRSRADLEEALWHALGCTDADQYALCEPVADAMRRAADAGHTVRLLSNCYLPGNLMRRLLRRTGVPEVYDRALFTADGGPKKPDTRAFELIGAGAFERRVMVGDSEELDIAPAAALGWDTVRVDAADPDPARLLTLLEL